MSCKKIIQIENITQVHKQNIDITKQMLAVAALKSATVIIRFRQIEVPSFAPLLNIINNQYPSSYFLLYAQSANRIGLLRKTITENGTLTKILNIYDNHQAQINLLNTIACTIEEKKGYRLYLNGSLLKEYQDKNAAFLSDIAGLAPLRAALIGKAVESQKLDTDRTTFLGDIDFLHIYDGILPSDKILKITGQTVADTAVRVPVNAYCSDAVQLFYPGYMGAPNYRIPSLLQTKNKTLLATIDQRMHGPFEHPNKIHILLRRCTDLGIGFGGGISVLKMPENSQSIDSSMIQDSETGRIFLLTDQFSESSTLFSVSCGTGFEAVDGQYYRQLLDDKGVKYLQDYNGVITCNSQPTAYSLGNNYNLFYNGSFAGYIFSERCPLRVYPTSYLVLLYSDDDGQTWSRPHDLNPYVKESWMSFLGCSPGRGLQLKYGRHKGRILFPVYYINPNGVQCSAFIYSDDHGETWKRGESCNDNRLFDGKLHHSLTLTDKQLDTNESQAVELLNGQVLLYCKSPFNETGCVAVAISRDGGESFDSNLKFDSALHSADSLSVISCECKVDGCDALIYAGSDSAGGSCNGAVKIGLINNTDSSVQWKYSRLVKPGTFGHCCLSMITNDIVGLFYESSGGLDMSFIKMDIAFLKSDDQPLHPVLLTDIILQPCETGTICSLIFNQPVMLCGNRSLKLCFKNRTCTANYLERHDDSKQYDFFIEKAKLEKSADFIISTSLRVFSVNGMCYIFSKKLQQFVWQYYSDENDRFFSVFSSHLDAFDDSKRLVSLGGSWLSGEDFYSTPDKKPAAYMGVRCNSQQMAETIMDYVKTNYSLSLNLNTLAKSINVNAAYLGRIFRNHIGQSFNSYVTGYRISKAKELLKNDSLMIYEIAQSVGYNDLDHFYMLFKKNTGMSPSAFRLAILKQQPEF